MDYKYENVLSPYGIDCLDQNWNIIVDLCLPTDKLRELYNEKLLLLEELRSQEPHKKRGKKYKYKCWIDITHDRRDELNLIAEELRKREIREK